MQTAGRSLPAVVTDALRGGARAVQLREKDLTGCQLFELADGLRAITRQYNAKLIINDRVDIALAVDADGVHVGKAGMPVAVVRRILGRDRLIGYSAHSIAEAQQAERDGADFVTFGPVYATPSKAQYGQPLGLELLAEAAQNVRIPVFALGGVKKMLIAQVMQTGVHGVALISAVISAPDPLDETKSLLHQIEHYDNPN
jgi:thiamine-phosphate pyrophosphorylase